MSLDPAIADWLARDVASDRYVRLKEAVSAHFSAFVKGDLIDDLDFMKRVSDRRGGFDNFLAQIWSARPAFVPKHRFFGSFFRRDWLVILRMRPRDRLRTDAAWDTELEATVAAWDNLFHPRQRHAGDELSDYVTNAEHYDERW